MSGNNEIGCTVLIDGQPINDGCVSTDVNVPTVLSGLKIDWGRHSTVDQPQAGSCVFHVIDPLHGQRVIPSLAIGRGIGVRVDTVVYPDPTVSTIPRLIPSGVTNAKTWTVAADGKTGTVVGASGATAGRQVGFYLPPLAYTSNPQGWDAVPRTLPGQEWRYTLTITEPAPFAGYSGWAAEVAPVYYVNPDGSGVQEGDWTTFPPGAPGSTVDITFIPPSGIWLGLAVHLYPTGPVWNQLDTTTWAALPGAPVPPPSTNLTTNPAPAAVTNWISNNATMWANSYAAGELSVNRGATATANIAASLYSLGLTTYNPVLPAGVNYQRAVEVWADAAATVAPISDGFVAGQAIPANTWTRVVQQFTGSGAAAYVTGIIINIPGVGTGVHVKLRKAQLMANPSGTTQPYFDGGTPDTATIDYAWTGTANASTSTATGKPGPPATTWDGLSTFGLSGMQMLAPAAGAAQSALVFSGRITDIRTQWDGGPYADVQVTAQDWLAELANRFVGDQPWNAEQLGARAQRIIGLSGQPIKLTVDTGVTSLQVTYRDVDKQPAAGLLQQLATSCGGILWTATHLVTGQVMRIEDILARPAALTLSDAGGLVHIIPSTSALVNALPITACDIDVEPVRFILDMTDTMSVVAVQWLEQTTDPGPPVVQRPTQRTVEVTEPNALAAVGARRMSVSTQLTTDVDATTQANQWLAHSSTMAWRIEGLRWDSTGDLNPDEISTLMTLLDGTRRNGLPIALTDLPAWAGPMTGGQDQVALYVEGGTYTYNAGSWVLELDTSSATGSAVGNTPWQNLDPGWSWNEFDPDMSWLDLYGVTYPSVAGSRQAPASGGLVIFDGVETGTVPQQPAMTG